MRNKAMEKQGCQIDVLLMFYKQNDVNNMKRTSDKNPELVQN